MMVYYVDDLWVMGYRICDYYMFFYCVFEYINLWVIDDVCMFNVCRNVKFDILIFDFGF